MHGSWHQASNNSVAMSNASACMRLRTLEPWEMAVGKGCRGSGFEVYNLGFREQRVLAVCAGSTLRLCPLTTWSWAPGHEHRVRMHVPPNLSTLGVGGGRGGLRVRV